MTWRAYPITAPSVSVERSGPSPYRAHPHWYVTGVSQDFTPTEHPVHVGSHPSKPWDQGYPHHYHTFAIEDRDGIAWANWDGGLNCDWRELIPWRPTPVLLSWLASLPLLPLLVPAGECLTFYLGGGPWRGPRSTRWPVLHGGGR